MFAAGGALLLGGGVVLSYLQSQPREQLSDLTLANLEALAIPPDEGLDIDYEVTTSDGTKGRCIGIGDCFEDLGVMFPGEWIPRI